MTQPPIDPNDRYQTLRDLGVPQDKAAAIANTRPAPAPTVSDRDLDLDQWSRDELERHAAERGIERPGQLSREALIRVMRERRRGSAEE